MARIGIDLDGTVVDFVGSYREHCKKFHADGNSTWPEPTHWDFYQDAAWGGRTSGEFTNCLEFYDSIFTNAKPYPGAEKALWRLAEAGHTLVFITDRSINPRAKQITDAWLEKHLPFLPYELHITANKASISVDYFIDDKPENVEAQTGKAQVSVLMDRPWNQISERARVYSLAEFAERVLEREQNTTIKPKDETVVTSSTGGQKGKKLARFDLIPTPALRKVAEVYGKGAEKYTRYDENGNVIQKGEWNWRLGYDWSLSIASLERHLADFKEGKSYHEDGHSLASVVFHALALMTFEEEHPEFDDRFKRPA